jgi:hypothetical protein
MATRHRRTAHEQLVKDVVLDEYAAHRRKLQAMGHDPDFIGTTEVAPVCCKGCGTPIPWRTLRGWQD